ncbi:MAG: hypothetical protein IJS45_03920 [Clostridia bacterium]|nr:hypothetical protein [Clostridia bacterium]
MITEDTVKNDVLTVVERTEKYRDVEKLVYILYRKEKDGRDSYSIQAIQYKNGYKVCQATSSDVSSLYEAAMEMFEFVSEGYVEPYVLCDVIYDLLP